MLVTMTMGICAKPGTSRAGRDHVEAGHLGHVVIGDDDADPLDILPQEGEPGLRAGEGHGSQLATGFSACTITGCSSQSRQGSARAWRHSD